ncbi:transcriptional regulator [Pseudoroseomonas deserti]|uniref:Transcriptional regulator n=1 Tax=Teichococcus deserti TaxID=1817963 RepID=A0A1V2H624_9PROT|nr:metalloregulator ArsR/SmtB family transcription factor [Pseudoroseomonas deserti]ONG56359.1 transcriptional regulator [Pseudoroseomonas deserti]
MDMLDFHNPLADVETHAAEAANLLRMLANERRLLLLCHLIGEGEVTVGRLAELVGLSQPALSQHLARLREDGLVATRRAGTTIHYRVADPRVARLLGVLHDIYQDEEESSEAVVVN